MHQTKGHGSKEDRNLQFRALEQDDLRETLRWRNSIGNREWFLNSDELTWESHQAWFAANTLREDDFVFVVTHDGTVVSQCSVYHIDIANERAEVGRFLTAPEHKGRGYASWGLEQLLDLAACTWNISTFDLVVKSGNLSARRLYERHGFESVFEKDDLVHMIKKI